MPFRISYSVTCSFVQPNPQPHTPPVSTDLCTWNAVTPGYLVLGDGTPTLQNFLDTLQIMHADVQTILAFSLPRMQAFPTGG